MVIFHFKHNYLNWRVIPCKRRMICVYAAFSSFSQHFLASWFSFRLSRTFQVHDMTINFSFFFVFLFFCFFFLLFLFLALMVCLLRATTHIIDGLSLKAFLLIWWSFWKGWLLVRGCSYHFCPKEKYGSKVFSKNGQFLVNMPQGINQDDFRISRS